MGIIKEIIYWTCVAGMIGTAAINLYCASRYQKMKKDLEAITESARKAKEMADEYLGKAVAWHDRAESCLSGRGSD